jgi:membrane protease YdiL (CAAX protease family)
MVSKTEIANKPFLQLILIAGLVIVSLVVFSIIGVVTAYLLYDLIYIDINNLASANKATLDALKVLQLFSAIGLFVVPPIVYAFIVSKKPWVKLNLKRFSKPINYVLVILLMFVSLPFMSWMVELNANLTFPDFLSGFELWAKSAEEQAMEQTKAFLTFNGLGSLLFAGLIVAIIPAIGEELLFRGVLQKILIQWTKNAHWGIWITALSFSALHMQFYGFFPRMLLGAVFGYLFFWSKSLWLPILGHFINNGSIVIYSYFYPESISEPETSLFSDNTTNVLISMLSLFMIAAVLWSFKKVNWKEKEELEFLYAPSENNLGNVLDEELINSNSEIN